MVTTQPESGTADTVTPDDTGTTFSKLRQLMTVTGNGEFEKIHFLILNIYLF